MGWVGWGVIVGQHGWLGCIALVVIEAQCFVESARNRYLGLGRSDWVVGWLGWSGLLVGMPCCGWAGHVGKLGLCLGWAGWDGRLKLE